MKISMFARVVAKPIDFPEAVEVIYHRLDENGKVVGPQCRGALLSWEQVKARYSVFPAFGNECEVDLRKGEARFLGNMQVEFESEENL